MMNANEARELMNTTLRNKADAYIETLEKIITAAASSGRSFAWADKNYYDLSGTAKTMVVAQLKEAGYAVTQVRGDLLIKWEI